MEIRRVGVQADDQLAERIARARSVLTIVNTRRHAARLYAMARERSQSDDGGVIHLSALMCPEHRARRVAEIKSRLKNGRPCRVVSTQVVEAGVDIDFPLVLRAMAGLDSIVQAAGRCNREGTLARGEVLVFDTAEKPAPSVLRAAGHAAEVLEDGVDAMNLKTIERYFRLHYWSRTSEWDGGPGKRITELLRQLLFRQADEAYRMIDDGAAVQVVVPYGDEGLVVCAHLLREARPGADVLRRAQRFSVNAAKWHVDRAVEMGVCVPSPAGPLVLHDPRSPHYREDVGLVLEQPPEPEDFRRLAYTDH